MNKFALYCGLLALAGAAFFVGEADGWRLVASYPTPGPNPRGYAFTYSSAGYIVMGGANPYVYYYDWGLGSIRSSFPAPGGAGAWGIARERQAPHLFITNNQTSWIYDTNMQGSVYNSFRCPFNGPADCDFTWYRRLVVAIPDRNIIALLNYTTGSLIGTYAGPGRQPTGAGGYVHSLVADAGTQTVYEDGIPVITGIETPVGFCIDWYIQPPSDVFMYLVDDATDRYYLYRRWYAAVEPASLGRVKALFR